MTLRKGQGHREVCWHRLCRDYIAVYFISIGSQVSTELNFHCINVAKCISDQYSLYLFGLVGVI